MPKRSGYGESALSRDRLNSLPVKRTKDGQLVNIKFRPQENPSCVTAYGGNARERGGRIVPLPMKLSEHYVDTSVSGVKEFVKVSDYKREYDNPEQVDTYRTADGKLEWTNRVYTNLYVTVQYLGILNNPTNRRKAYKVYAANDYAESLREANVCNTCFKPLKTQIAKIAYKENLEIVRDTIIATVKSHFELRRSGETGKYYFVYVDGSNRKILARKGRMGNSEFYLESGEVVHPVSEYTVERQKCGCGLK